MLAGYGYRLWRIAVAYLLTVTVFAAGYLLAGYLTIPGQAPTGGEVLNALQISLNAIHGRVFFAQFGLDTVQSWLATIESIIGILIEGVFVGAIRSLETVMTGRGMRGIPCGMTTGCSLTGANPCPSR